MSVLNCKYIILLKKEKMFVFAGSAVCAYQAAAA